MWTMNMNNWMDMMKPVTNPFMAASKSPAEKAMEDLQKNWQEWSDFAKEDFQKNCALMSQTKPEDLMNAAAELNKNRQKFLEKKAEEHLGKIKGMEWWSASSKPEDFAEKVSNMVDVSFETAKHSLAMMEAGAKVVLKNGMKF